MTSMMKDEKKLKALAKESLGKLLQKTAHRKKFLGRLVFLHWYGYADTLQKTPLK